jgi:tRNA 5-methylaminomethyl-2-thiouridine biosynthesis bifunctional protein
MKTRPIVPAELAPSPSGDTPYSPLYGDVYHSAAGAFEQAEHVFMGGNDLPHRWQGRPRFVILETGFGLGNNFLATWAAWRGDAQRSERLVFVSIEKHPLTRDDLARVHARLPADAPHAELTRALVDAWPALTPNLHTLTFDDGRVQLLLGFGDVADVLPALVAEVDVFYLDGFAPAKNPEMWDEHVLKRLSRLAAPGATAATWSFARGVRDGLSRAGFDVQRAPGFAGKRDMLVAHYAPRHVAARPVGAPRTPDCAREALIIGGGLAGCAAAWGLSEQGWHSTVLDRHAAPACEASGNPAGLFHGIVNRDDGPHARLHRAAALTTARLLRPWIEQGRVPGQCQGLLRLEPRLGDDEAQALLTKLGLPANYVSWLCRDAAQARSGVPVPSGGWWFGDGGWVQPGALAAALLDESGARFVGERSVARLDQAGGLWRAWSAEGDLLGQAPVAVIACGTQTGALLPTPDAAPVTLTPVRGQVSWLPSGLDGVWAPLAPVAGAGYALHAHGDRLVFGATLQHHDPDPAVRAADHQHNLTQAQRLGVARPTNSLTDSLTDSPATFDALAGRVGWRAVTPDRLPVIGAVAQAANRRPEQARHVDHPRHAARLQDASGGLYVLGGLGSRGITWSALAGRVLAAWVTGAPAPVEMDLLYCMDPARFPVGETAAKPRASADD